MMKYLKFLTFTALTVLLACQNQEDQADAYGNFEAIEVIIAAETQGRIEAFDSMEGDPLEEGQVEVAIDTIQLHLIFDRRQSFLYIQDRKGISFSSRENIPNFPGIILFLFRISQFHSSSLHQTKRLHVFLMLSPDAFRMSRL